MCKYVVSNAIFKLNFLDEQVCAFFDAECRPTDRTCRN